MTTLLRGWWLILSAVLSLVELKFHITERGTSWIRGCKISDCYVIKPGRIRFCFLSANDILKSTKSTIQAGATLWTEVVFEVDLWLVPNPSLNPLTLNVHWIASLHAHVVAPVNRRRVRVVGLDDGSLRPESRLSCFYLGWAHATSVAAVLILLILPHNLVNKAGQALQSNLFSLCTAAWNERYPELACMAWTHYETFTFN